MAVTWTRHVGQPTRRNEYLRFHMRQASRNWFTGLLFDRPACLDATQFSVPLYRIIMSRKFRRGAK